MFVVQSDKLLNLRLAFKAKYKRNVCTLDVLMSISGDTIGLNIRRIFKAVDKHSGIKFFQWPLL